MHSHEDIIYNNSDKTVDNIYDYDVDDIGVGFGSLNEKNNYD